MSEQNSGFGKFVPGFDFLQGLARGASQGIPQMPSLSSWVAPTLNVEELDKRITELKAVHFWLDQNGKALSATIQALEVQKMTLATLKGMNFSMGDMANAFKLKAADAVSGGAQKVMEKVSGASAPATAEPAPRAKAPPKRAKTAAKSAPGVVDPMQWWGSLTQQFQQIAAGAMKDAAKQTAIDTTKNLAGGLAKGALKTASGAARAATRMAVAGANQSLAAAANRKTAPARKSRAKR